MLPGWFTVDVGVESAVQDQRNGLFVCNDALVDQLVVDFHLAIIKRSVFIIADKVLIKELTQPG